LTGQIDQASFEFRISRGMKILDNDVYRVITEEPHFYIFEKKQ
jgi:hypothetical protein